ncbi:MAG TPA: ABC transporter ATP-binding protein [Terriglobales bacterium]|nr:ABC transporter ATP-binding protein [Terriglobales bacterium]
MAAVLEFEGITKHYRRRVGLRPEPLVALEDFSLAVERGEIFGFLGPNGAGKTTAIHIAMGFTRPTRGAGRMLGRAFGHAPTRARVGFLAENVALYHRPARKLVAFYGALNGMRGRFLRERVRQVLEELELTADAGRNAGRFSRGMQQRVGLAQALVNDPELLMLDEPTSALDPLGRVAVRELLLKARERGKTVFLSSHLLSEVELICDRVGILHRGRLVRVAKTGDLLERHDQSELAVRNVAPAMFPGAEARDGVVQFTVPRAAQRAAIERVWAAGGEIVAVNPARRSLEEIFVEMTSESGSNQ